jgi:hypothetical protein
MGETEDYDKSATPTAHASTHEDGGSDEISVEGLSGLLADAQTPAAHNHDGVYSPIGHNHDGIYEAAGATATHAALTTDIHGVGASTVASIANIATHAALSASVHGVSASGFEDKANKAQAAGYCDLDASALVPLTRIPTTLTGKDADLVDGQHRVLTINADHTHQSTGAQGGQLDHGLALTGLLDDDHPIYAILGGRAGGQVIYGGTGTWEHLHLLPNTAGDNTGMIICWEDIIVNYEQANNGVLYFGNNLQNFIGVYDAFNFYILGSNRASFDGTGDLAIHKHVADLGTIYFGSDGNDYIAFNGSWYSFYIAGVNEVAIGNTGISLASGNIIQINANQVVGARVVDARIDDTIGGTWDASAQGILDACRDALQSHGLCMPS